MADPAPFVEILAVGAGHASGSSRLDHTRIGRDLRYLSHTEELDHRSRKLRIVQRDDRHGVEVTAELSILNGTGAVRSVLRIENIGAEKVVLRSATSWSSSFGTNALAPEAHDFASWTLLSGTSEWLGENRWSSSNLRAGAFPAIREDLTGSDRRSSAGEASYGTWSTSGGLPVAGVEAAAHGVAWAWQIEHNGGWRWEIGDDVAGGGKFALAGPTDRDHAFTKVLRPGDSFATVPVTVALGHDFEGAIACLTRHRRAARRPHSDNTAMSVVFNDYMNTLNGNPTTERLLPLLESAARAGAEIFCIDAGWYDETGSWWGSVGEWEPSERRFPGGLGEVVDRIRELGMIPGLWLEPEVVGVRSPLAQRLPEEAFFARHGVRVEEHQRFHLDLRHPAAVHHLDEVVDRLIATLGVGYFKFDYNINPGAGTDHDADSAGDGLLQHNRAHLRWLDDLHARHPELILENCASGAMRMDFALLSRLQLQSTSDQQDFRLYPPIAAGAPLSLLPEQAANWSYPQPDMSDEEIAFCLVTGLLGRFYLSGYLSEMSEDQLRLVRAAVESAKALRSTIRRSTPFWPLGLPEWTAPWTALGLDSVEEPDQLVSVWRRSGGAAPLEATLDLHRYRGRDVLVETVFPRSLPAWSTDWDRSAGRLTVRARADVDAARTFRIRPVIGRDRPNG